MKVVLKRNTPDYREALELFSQFKAKGTTYLTYDYTTKDYLIECNQEASTYSEVMRIVLSDVSQRFLDQLNTEEKDALAYTPLRYFPLCYFPLYPNNKIYRKDIGTHYESRTKKKHT